MGGITPILGAIHGFSVKEQQPLEIENLEKSFAFIKEQIGLSEEEQELLEKSLVDLSKKIRKYSGDVTHLNSLIRICLGDDFVHDERRKTLVLYNFYLKGVIPIEECVEAFKRYFIKACSDGDNAAVFFLKELLDENTIKEGFLCACRACKQDSIMFLLPKVIDDDEVLMQGESFFIEEEFSEEFVGNYVSQKKHELLQLACLQNDETKALCLIATMDKKDLGRVNEKGETALMIVCRCRNEKIILALVDKMRREDICKRDKKGLSALIYSWYFCNKKIQRALKTKILEEEKKWIRLSLN